MPWTILTPRERELVMREVIGQGGAQDLLRMIHTKVKYDGDLTLTDDEAARVKRYAKDWKPGGGFQQRFQAIVDALERTDY